MSRAWAQKCIDNFRLIELVVTQYFVQVTLNHDPCLLEGVFIVGAASAEDTFGV